MADTKNSYVYRKHKLIKIKMTNEDQQQQIEDETVNTPTVEEQVRAARLMAKRRERSRAAYKANPDKFREKNRARRQRIREASGVTTTTRRKVIDDTEEGIAAHKLKVEQRKEKNREYARERYRKNPELCTSRQKKYRENRRIAYAAYKKNQELQQTTNPLLTV